MEQEMLHFLPLLLFLSGTVFLALAVFSLWRRPSRVFVPFFLLVLLAALWALGYGAEIETDTLSGKLLLAKAEYLSIASIPTLWLVFTFQYTGRKRKLHGKFLALLLLEPLATILLAWTNQWHHLLYTRIELARFGGLLLLKATRGPWFWVHVAYSYALLTVATVLILDQYRRSGEEGRKQAVILLAASMIPWVGNFISARVPLSTYAIDLTPVFLLVTCLIAAVGIWRFRILDIVPIARGIAVEEMPISYMVLDNEYRILDMNKAAEKAFGRPRAGLVGKSLFEVMSPILAADKSRKVPLPFRQVVEVNSRFLEVQGEPVEQEEGERAGVLVIWRDVTEQIIQNRLLEEKVNQLNSINYVVEVINKATTLREIYEAAMRAILRTLQAEKSSILLFDANGVMRFEAWKGLSEEYRKAVEGHSPWTPDAVDPQPIFVEDIEKAQDPGLLHLKEVILKEGVRSLGFVPIVHQGRLLGKFMVYYPTPHKFTERDVELSRSIAGHLAIAIEKARLLERARERLRRIEILQAMDRAISSTLNLNHQIDILLTYVLKELRGDLSSLFLIDERSRKIVPVMVKGSYNPPLHRDTSFEIGEGGVGWIVLHKKPLYIPDVSKDPRWKVMESSLAERVVTYLGVPLIADEEVLGAIDVSNRHPRSFTREEIDFLQALAGQAAIAIKNAKLYQRLRKRVAQMEALYEISREITTEHDLHALLQKIVDRATELLEAPSGGIYLYNEKQRTLTVAVVKGTELPLGKTLRLGEGMAGKVAETRRPMIVDNYSHWEYRSDKYQEVPFTAVVEVPMLHSGELIGVLAVNELGYTGRKFTEEDAKLLSLLASHAADAVYNARLIDRLRRRVERQQTLYRISVELSRLRDRQKVCDMVVKLLHEKLKYRYVCVLLLDPDTGEKIVASCSGKGFQQTGQRIPKGIGLVEKTIKTGTLHYWPDVTKEPEYNPIGEDSRSEVDIPIRSQERLLGVLSVEDETEDAFDQEDFDVLQTVANQLAISLENAQRMQEIASLLQSTTRLYQASQAIARAATVEEVARVTVRSLRKASEADAVVINIFVEGHKTSYAIDAQGKESPDMCKGQLPDEVLRLVVSSRTPILLGREKLPEMLRERGVVQALVIPLVGEKGTLGAMAIWYFREVKLSPQQMESYSIYASQTAVAIEKAISMEEANQKATEQEVVSGIARALNEALDVEKAFPQVVAGIRRLVHADRISVALTDEKENRFMISVLYDVANVLPPARWYPMSSTAAAGDVMKGEVHVTHDLAKEAGSPGEGALYHAGYRSRVNIPLRVGSDVIGALNVASRNVGEFTPDKLPTLLQIADVLAISIANSRSFQEEQKRARELASLYSLSRKLSSLNDVEDVVEASVQAMLDSIEGLSYAKAILLKEQFRFPSSAAAITTPHCAWIDDLAPYPGIARALEGGNECQNISVNDPHLSPAERDLLFTRGGEFVCLFPLKRGSEPLGIIAVESHKNRYSGLELQLAGSISELTAMAFRRVLLFREVEEAYINAVLSLAKAIDAKDSYTSNHSQQLEAMAVAVAVEMGLDRQTIEDLRFGAQLHDVGKIGMPDSILKKPGPLSPKEWSTMHRHPEIGEKILSPLPRLRGAAAIVRHHHERYDGKGYPDGLKGEEIPIGARILAVVDAYSAIVDRRVYKEPRPHEEAIEELKRNAGTQFDPKVVEVFLRIFGANPILPHVIVREETPGDGNR